MHLTATEIERDLLQVGILEDRFGKPVNVYCRWTH